MLEAQAISIADRIDSVIPQEGTASVQREIALLPNKNYLAQMNIDHADAAYLELHQGDTSSLRERALYALLAESISAPYFAELRTREQLGYIVLARPYPMDGLPGLILYIQSPSTDPALLQLYSQRFLNRYGQELINMNDSTFNTYKQGLITSLKEPAKNLYQLSSQYWSSIQEGNSHFNTQQRIATEIEKISLDGFRRFYKNRILGDESSSLTIHQIGKSMKDDYIEHAASIGGRYPIENTKDWPEDVVWVSPVFNHITQ
jgi:secreted Zn-dependent insulinase-like peptidase